MQMERVETALGWGRDSPLAAVLRHARRLAVTRGLSAVTRGDRRDSRFSAVPRGRRDSRIKF